MGNEASFSGTSYREPSGAAMRQVTRSDRFRGLTMVAAMEDLRRRQDARNLVEHADEIFDRLLRAFGGDLGAVPS